MITNFIYHNTQGKAKEADCWGGGGGGGSLACDILTYEF